MVVAASIGTAAAVTFLSSASALAGLGAATVFMTWMRRSARHSGNGDEKYGGTKNASKQASTGDWSWQAATLGLFAVTVALAILTLLEGSRASSNSNLTATDIFTDLAGAGTLVSGITAALVFWTGYREKRKRDRRQANMAVLNNAIQHIGHSLEPDDIHALAELARALNGNQDILVEKTSEEIAPSEETSP
jgi:hypothetical protein